MKQINIKLTDLQKKKIDEVATIKGLSLKDLIIKSIEEYGKKESSQNIVDLVDVLSKQLEEKDQQIKSLTQLLNQEQQLNANNVKKIELLELKNEDEIKKSWWNKLLGK